MCRMMIYKSRLEQSILLSDLIVKPNHSIIRQSYNCQERFHDTGLPPQLNADGFGIGWYAESMYRVKESADVISPKTKRRREMNLVDLSLLKEIRNMKPHVCLQASRQPGTIGI